MSGPHRHYTYYWRRCANCGAPADGASEFCNECEPDPVDDTEDREPPEADAVPCTFACTCRWRYAPWGSAEPPEPILDRLCPRHGDGGPDPDQALEERLQAIRDRQSDLLDNGD